jgi:hypothetical protein
MRDLLIVLITFAYFISCAGSQPAKEIKLLSTKDIIKRVNELDGIYILDSKDSIYSVYFSQLSDPDENTLKFLNECESLFTIELSGDGINSKCLNFLESSHIKSISFLGCNNLTGENFKFLSKIKSLRHVNILGKYDDRVIDSISKIQNLSTLSLSCSECNYKNISKIDSFNKLHKITINNSKIDKTAVRDILTSNVKNIFLDYSTLSNVDPIASALSIAEEVSMFYSKHDDFVVKLALTSKFIHTLTLGKFAENRAETFKLLGENRTIKKLRFTNQAVNDKEIASLIKMKQLETLSIDECEFGLNELKQICGLPVLSKLGIDGYGHIDIEEAKILSNSKSLIEIDMHSTSLTLPAFKKISNMKSLIKLRMSRSNLNIEIVDYIKSNDFSFKIILS